MALSDTGVKHLIWGGEKVPIHHVIECPCGMGNCPVIKNTDMTEEEFSKLTFMGGAWVSDEKLFYLALRDGVGHI